MGSILIDVAVRGSLIGLLAVGLTLVQGTLRFANVAHVEFATVGGYVAATLTGLGLGLLPSSVLGAGVVAIAAVVLHRLVFRRLLGSGPLIALIGSLALAITMRALLQLLYGSRPRNLPIPLERGFEFMGAFITPTQVRVVVISLLLLAGLLVLLHLTSLGRALRAVASNPDLADVSGLNRQRVVDVVWMVSAGLAAVSGILLAMNSTLGIELGFSLLLPVFAASIVGGLGSVVGALIAAYVIALFESVALWINWGAVFGTEAYLAVSYRPAVGFVLLVIMLIFRPQGLMGRTVRRG